MLRVAQAAAVAVAIIAAAVFLIPMPIKEIEVAPPRTAGPGPGQDAPDRPTFRVPEQDWTLALDHLSAHRDPVVDGGPGSTIAGGNNNDPNAEEEDPNEEQLVRPTQKPPVKYLGHIEDAAGLAALIDFAGRQRILRVGQEFEQEYELLEITPQRVTITNGFVDFTYDRAQSILAEALPAPTSTRPANNRARPARPTEQPGLGQPGKPEPRRPTPQPENPDDEGTPTR